MPLRLLLCLTLLPAVQDSPINKVLVTTLHTSEPLWSQGRLGGVSTGADGSIYVSNFGASVWRVMPDGEATRLLGSLKGSSGNAVDREGNLLQASFLDNRIVRIKPDGSVSDYVTQGLNGPVGMLAHSDGNLYVCNCRGNSVSKIDPQGQASELVTSPHFDCPNGIAAGPGGALYVVSYNNGDVVRVGLDGSVALFATVPDGSNAHIAFARGSFFVTKIGANKVYRLDPTGQQIEWFAGSGEATPADGPAREAGLARANGIAASPDGNTLYLNTLEGAWKGEERTRLWLRRIHLDGKEPAPSTVGQAARIQIRTGAFVFDALAAGPEDGELVLLLHGFPQTSYAFRHQIAALAKAGYRAVAPDQRGYSRGARPTAVEAYAMGALVSDVVAMADALGRETFYLVGHDWGGAVAWVTAARHPERIKALVVLSTPHFAAMQSGLADPQSEQAQRSSYFQEFGAAGAEQKFLADDSAFQRSLYQGGGLTPEEIQVYVDALGTDKAMRSALHWYGALIQGLSQAPPPSSQLSLGPLVPAIRVPTLYVWSTEDAAFSRSAAEATGNYVTGPYRFEVLEGVSHWVPEQAAERVNEMILQHFGRGR